MVKWQVHNIDSPKNKKAMSYNSRNNIWMNKFL